MYYMQAGQAEESLEVLFSQQMPTWNKDKKM
jgi:hypothetical protein